MKFPKIRQLAVLAVFGGYFGSFLASASLLPFNLGGKFQPTWVLEKPRIPFLWHIFLCLKILTGSVTKWVVCISRGLNIRGGSGPNFSSLEPCFFRIFEPRAGPGLGSIKEIEPRAFDFELRALNRALKSNLKMLQNFTMYIYFSL